MGNLPKIELASMHDLNVVDIEAPLAGILVADYHEYFQRYASSLKAVQDNTPEHRLFSLLSHLMGMHFRPEDRAEPFGPMAVFEGQRSAIPDDFREDLDLIEALAHRAKNPVLRARLADVCWVIDLKRGRCGQLALQAYVDIVRAVQDGSLRYRSNESIYNDLSFESRDLLRRALRIARRTGWSKTNAEAAKALCRELRQKAFEQKALVPFFWFCELEIEQRIGDFALIGSLIEALLKDNISNDHSCISLWKLAAGAYGSVNQKEDQARCLEGLSSCYVAMSETSNSALVGASFLEDAISALHGLPKSDRRRQLQDRLKNIQGKIADELTTFSMPLDLTGLIAETEKALNERTLLDCLFVIAGISQSPNPTELREAANEVIAKHPMSSLFGASYLDHEGKTLRRSAAHDDQVVLHKMSQLESLRRTHIAYGVIEPALNYVAAHHTFSANTFTRITRISGFVPSFQFNTFAQGFLRFFQRDYVGASYILVPLLESALKHVLKQNGHDVTRFDDATKTQKDRTISLLFEQMRAELDKIFGSLLTAEIENLFLAKEGPALRHSLCHGLLHDGEPHSPDAIYACWLIFKLCLYPLYPHRNEIELD